MVNNNLKKFFKFDIFTDSSSFNEKSEKKEKWLDEVSSFSDKKFIHCFRMKKQTFKDLLLHFKKYNIKKLKEKLYIFIYFISHMISYRRLENQFNIPRGTLWRYIEEISSIIELEAYKYINLPDSSEFSELSDGFLRHGNYSGTILSIDGTDLVFTKPGANSFDYYTRKMSFAIKLICIVDWKKRFRGVSYGFGSSHDAYIYRISTIKNFIDNLPDEYHVVGDPAFRGFNNILNTYESANNDTDEYILLELKKQRIVVENAFALFKNKFKRFMLKSFVKNQKRYIKHVKCAIFLHNFIIDNN